MAACPTIDDCVKEQLSSKMQQVVLKTHCIDSSAQMEISS